MRMTAGPDFTWLCLIGGAAEEEAFQCGTVKGEEGPEVTEACEVGVVIMESDTSVRPIIKPGRPHNPVVTQGEFDRSAEHQQIRYWRGTDSPAW